MDSEDGIDPPTKKSEEKLPNSGRVRFSNLTKEELKEFRVIPENGKGTRSRRYVIRILKFLFSQG